MFEILVKNTTESIVSFSGTRRYKQ